MGYKLQRISVDDNIVFSRDSAMERCFSPYSISPRKAVADTHDGCVAWFPKAEYRDQNGRIKSGAQSTNWKNHFEDGNEKIIMWLYDDEPVSENTKEPEFDRYPHPHHCFWCADHREKTVEKYKYVGTYLADVNSSEPRNVVFRRIQTLIDLSQWYSHDGDFEWRDPETNGLEVYKKYYIKGYRKQKELLESFKDELLPDVERYEQEYIKIISQVLTIPINDLKQYFERLSSLLKQFDGSIYDFNGLLKSLDNDSVGMSVFDVVQSARNRDNRHNKLIRCSVLGQVMSSKLFSLYDAYYYLYSLSEDETEFYLDKLNLRYDVNADITEKHSLLYFWKQCNDLSMSEMTPFQFVYFLRYVFGEPNSKAEKRSEEIEDNAVAESSSYLITWKPTNWNEWPGGYSSIAQKVSAGETYTEAWRFSNSNVKPGDTCYLMRLGVEPKGIIGKGVARSFIKTAPHDDPEKAKRGEVTKRIDVEFTDLVDFETDSFIRLDDLMELFPEQQWTPQSSGIAIKDNYIKDLDDLWKLIGFKKNSADSNNKQSSGLVRIIPVSEAQKKASEEADFVSSQEVDVLLSEKAEDRNYEYIPTPEDKIIIENSDEKLSKKTYPRDAQKRINALNRAGYSCEYSSDHQSFISKRTNKPYMETHHLIPLEFWESFNYSLDVEANIICLCSNCHNQIHYGRDAEDLIVKLYEKRIHELESAGIYISKEQLLGMYNGDFDSD